MAVDKLTDAEDIVRLHLQSEYVIIAGYSWVLQKQTLNKKGGVSKNLALCFDVRQIFPTGELE